MNQTKCPYCFQPVTERNVKHRCCTCHGFIAADFLEQRIQKKPIRCRNKSCLSGGVELVCPHCDTPLPSDFLRVDKQLTIAVLGATNSGKSTFLATMIHELRQPNQKSLVVSAMDHRTRQGYRGSEMALWQARRPLAATTPGLPQPQLWRLQTGSQLHALTLFDIAGENCEHIDPAISRFMTASDMLFLLIDPTTIPALAEDTGYTESAADIVHEVADFVRNTAGVRGNKVTTPAAVILSKFDTLSQKFGYSVVARESPHTEKGGFVLRDADAVDLEVKSFLSRYSPEVVQAIDVNFSNVRYFAVSALGQEISPNGHVGKIACHRLLDPLYWALSRKHIIPTL